MNKSDSIKELATALAKVQAELKNPPFDSKNPHFKSNYASLASVRDTITPVFAKHGLSIIQNVSSRENEVCCSNMILHVSGEWYESDLLCVPADKHNAHGYGSACTYARRFSLMALGCVVGDTDDDGNSAIKVTPNAGAGDDLNNDQKNRLADVATAIKDSFEIDDDAAMMTFYTEVTEQAEKLYLWSLLASQIRTKIKKLGQEQK